MKIKSKNSLLFFVGLFIVLIVIVKLFGLIVFYVVLSLFVGYLIGDSWGVSRGKEAGRLEEREKIIKEFEQTNRG